TRPARVRMRGPGSYPPEPSLRANPHSTRDCRMRWTVDLETPVAAAMSVTRWCSAIASSTASALSMELPSLTALSSLLTGEPPAVDRAPGTRRPAALRRPGRRRVPIPLPELPEVRAVGADLRHAAL